MAGPTCRVQPWPELGDVWALEGMAQGVAFDDTLGVSRLDRSVGGERKGRKGSVPLLDLTPPPASKLQGLTPPLLPSHRPRVLPPQNLRKLKCIPFLSEQSK